MRRILIGLGALATLAACNSQPDELAVFDGAVYRTSLKAERGDPRGQFNVVVRDAAQGLSGAREAGRYEAIKHCIRETASSEIEWAIGPDTADSALPISEGSLILTGRCVDPR